MTAIHKRVVDECREDLSFKPPWELLDQIGNSFLEIPMSDPIRTWWLNHQLTTRSPEETNAIFLDSQGIDTADSISLDW